MTEIEKNATATPPRKINIKETFLIGFGFFSCMFAWFVYNFQMPIILAGKISEDGINFIRVGILGTGVERQFYSGLIMTLDNILAISLQPWFGKLSDRLESKLGRRTPFMMIGIPIAAAMLILMAFAEELSIYAIALLSFFILVIIFNLAMSFYRAPIVALLPDRVPAKDRSVGNAIINLTGGIGIGVGFILPIVIGSLSFVKARIVSTGDFATQDFFIEDLLIFVSTAVLLLITLILFLILVKEVPSGTKFWHLADYPLKFDVETNQFIHESTSELSQEEKKKANSIIDDLKGVFKEPDKSGVFILLAVFAWYLAFNALETNFSRWTQEYLLLKGGLISQLFLALPIALVVVGIPAAKIAEKLGRKKTITLGIIFMIISLSGMIIVQELLRAEVLGGNESPNIWGLAICIAFMGMGWALININSIVIVWQIAPKEKIGSYTGLYYFFSQLAQILSPSLLGFILMIGEIWVGPVYTWRSILPFMLVGMVLALIFMLRVKRGEADLSKEDLKALQSKFGADD